MRTAVTRPAGTISLAHTRPDGSIDLIDEHGSRTLPAVPRSMSLRDMVRLSTPSRGLPKHVNEWRASNIPNVWRGFRRCAAAKAVGCTHVYGALFLRHYRADGSVDDLGLASLRVVTDAGVAAIVDAFENTVELENFDFHGFGTGGTAEAVGQTALVTELTTQYATDNTRPTGTPSQPSANIYQSVGTLDPDADVAITEHGLFSQAATGGGTMLDRSLFSVVNVTGATGDSLQATYQFSISSGG